MPSSYADTAYPNDVDSDGKQSPNKSFHRLKYELSRISEAVLEVVLKIDEPSYSSIQLLQEQLNTFEKSLPYHLRCRSALISIPSLYPDTSKAIIDSPEVDKRNLALTLQVSVTKLEKGAELIHSNSLWRSQSRRRYSF